MRIYHYDSITKEYLGTSIADNDPLVEGSWLIPANATTVPAQEQPTGFAMVWDTGTWRRVEDHRGMPGYIGETPVVITELGTLPEGWSSDKPKAVVTREVALKEINKIKNNKRDNGLTLDGVRYDTDAGARLAYAELAVKFMSDPSFSTMWKASEGTWIEMVKSRFDALSICLETHIRQAFEWQAAKEIQLAATEDADIAEFVEHLND